MSRFLFTTLPSNDLGLLTRSLPIARELARGGHQIAFCNTAPAPSKVIAQAGFDNLPIRHPLYYAISIQPGRQGLAQLMQLAHREFGLFNFFKQLIRAMPTSFTLTSEVGDMDDFGAISGMASENFMRASCEAMMALMTEWKPDVVVDFLNPFACVAARVLRKPLVSVIQADMHPDSGGFIWWKDRPPSSRKMVMNVNKVLASYQLPSVAKSAQVTLGDLTLVVGMPETDPLPASANVTYIGPVLWENPGAVLPAWIEALSQDKPIIWVYSGNPRYVPIVHTPVDSAVVLSASIAALADEDVQVVLTTGHQPLPQEFLPLPANFRHEPFVPGLTMARKSQLLIHHGGYGSCQTGLYTGTPAVIIPTYSERESNARRVAAVGAGDFVLPIRGAWGKKVVQPEELRAKARRVLSDPSFVLNARRIGEKLQAYGGAAEAARLIEAVI